ncbi:AI-2E family transporter [soil metagenome]
MPQKQEVKEFSFVQKVWIVGGIFALVAIILLLFEATFRVIILLFAGTLIAGYFRGLSGFIGRRTGWSSKLTLPIAIVGTLFILAGITWLIGSEASSQTTELKEALPGAIENVKNFLNETDVGRAMSDKLSELEGSNDLSTYVSFLFRSTFGFLGDILIILIIGIFFTASPRLYIDGLLQLIPPAGREKGENVVQNLGSGLKKWLAGKFLAMLAVFILTAVGLLIIGVPMWLALALLAGILNFVPNFGPIAAGIPAVLIALAISPATAGIVAILYLVVQLLESGLINPMAQKKLIKIPPALIIISQLLVGALTGIWGVILATPLVLVVIILVRELYVKPMNKGRERQT